MTLQIWFQDDISRVLNGLATAHTQTAKRLPHTAETVAYQSGFQDALIAVATGFGLTAETFLDERPTVMVLEMPVWTHS